VVYLMI